MDKNWLWSHILVHIIFIIYAVSNFQDNLSSPPPPQSLDKFSHTFSLRVSDYFIEDFNFISLFSVGFD